ncbi:MAG: PAS domain-containing protein [Kineosporiaceae bacterium]
MTATREPAGAAPGVPSGWEGAEVAVVDTDGVIVAVNDEWMDFCRRNGGDPVLCGVGTSYLAACDQAAGDPVADAVGAALRAAVEGRRSVPERVIVPCHTPTARRWYDIHVVPRVGDDGEPQGASVAVVPLAAPADPESSAAAARLGLPYGDLLDVLDLVPDPVLVLDRRLRVVHANLGAAHWLGYAPDHLAGLSLTDLGTPSGAGPDPLAPRVADAIRDAPDGSLVQRWEFRSRAGEVRTAEAHLHLSGGAGDGVRVVLVARDVAEREAQDRVRRRQAMLAARMADITTALLGGCAPEDVYDRVAAAAVEVTEADDAAVVLPDGRGGLLRAAVAGEAARAMEAARVPVNPAVAAAAFDGGRGVAFDTMPDPDPAVRGLVGPVAVSPVVVADRAHGMVSVARRPGAPAFSEADVDLLDRLAVQLGLVVQIARGRAARQRLALLQDRQRIARDLHDTVIQDLLGLGMHLHAETGHEPDPARRARDSELVDRLDRVVRALRAAVFQLRDTPPGATVTDTVESLVAEAARALGHVPALRLTGPVDDLPAEPAAEVAPVLREALSNVTRHAAARSTRVSVTVGGGHLRLVVEDDGRGPAADGRGGTGLVNLRQRAAALGGDAGLTARPEGGSRLWWTCPVRPSVADPPVP